MNRFLYDIYGKPYRTRERCIHKILMHFREAKYIYMLMGYFTYLPDNLITFIDLEMYKYNGLLDGEKFNEILKLIDERIEK